MNEMIQLTEVNSNAEVFVAIDSISAIVGAHPNQMYNGMHNHGMSVAMPQNGPLPSLNSNIMLKGGGSIFVNESPRHVMLLLKESKFADHVNKAIVT